MEKQITGDADELGGGGLETPPDDMRLSGHVLSLIPCENGHSSVKM